MLTWLFLYYSMCRICFKNTFAYEEFMKIEKINDHKIRCTLTREDLAKRNINIDSLEYGTPEAHKLFNDMMKQASEQYGFIAEDTPISVEAIPSEHESVILIITADSDTDEIDTSFSTFSPEIHDISHDLASERNIDSDQSPDEDFYDSDNDNENMSDVANLFRSLQGNLSPEDSASLISSEFKHLQKLPHSDNIAVSSATLKDQAYRFESINDIIKISNAILKIYNGNSTLLHQAAYYILLLHDNVEKSNVTSLMSEYSKAIPLSKAGLCYLQEHGSVIIESNALQKLSHI